MKNAILLLSYALTLLFMNSAHAEDGKTIQIYLSPVGTILGVYEAGVEFRVSDNLSIAPEIYSINFRKDEIFSYARAKATGYGARVIWQFNGANIGDGWFASFRALTMPTYTLEREFKSTAITPNLLLTGTTSNLQLQLTGGYRWVWGLFSLWLGAGILNNSLPAEMTLQSADGSATSTAESADFGYKSGSVFRGELIFGLAF